jgi:hypothetical protein
MKKKTRPLCSPMQYSHFSDYIYIHLTKMFLLRPSNQNKSRDGMTTHIIWPLIPPYLMLLIIQQNIIVLSCCVFHQNSYGHGCMRHFPLPLSISLLEVSLQRELLLHVLIFHKHISWLETIPVKLTCRLSKS